MSREYDAQSKAATTEYRENFDRIFGKKPSKTRRVATQNGEKLEYIDPADRDSGMKVSER